MLQRNEEHTVSRLEARTNGIYHEEDLDALLRAKDGIIAELRAQVALLHRELKRKDAVLSRIAENIGELSSARVSATVEGPRTVTARGLVRVDNTPASNGQQRQEKPERPTLPDGYRVVAIASDAWVLVTTRGVRVAGYRGKLDLGKVALDACEHHQRKE
jgi:hypothetical protein